MPPTRTIEVFTKVECPNCGFMNLHIQQFCGNCGARLVDGPLRSIPPIKSSSDIDVSNTQSVSKEFNKILAKLKSLRKITADNIKNRLPTAVSINGITCSVTPLEGKDYDSFITEFLDKELSAVTDTLSNYVEQFRKEVESKIHKIEGAMKQKGTLMSPPDLEFVIKNDIQIARYEDYTLLILPFTYAPKTLNGKEITDPDPKTLVKEILVAFNVEQKGDYYYIKGISLLNYDHTFFGHYHRYNDTDNLNFKGNNDCWGQYKHPERAVIADFPQIRNRLQDTLENIHRESANYNRMPDGLPCCSDIVTSLKSSVWKKK
jgi:hypothetical protein